MRPLLDGCRVARGAGGDAPGGEEPCQETLCFAGLHGRQALAAQPTGMGFRSQRAKEARFVLHVPCPMTRGRWRGMVISRVREHASINSRNRDQFFDLQQYCIVITTIGGSRIQCPGEAGSRMTEKPVSIQDA